MGSHGVGYPHWILPMRMGYPTPLDLSDLGVLMGWVTPRGNVHPSHGFDDPPKTIAVDRDWGHDAPIPINCYGFHGGYPPPWCLDPILG